MSRQKLTLRLNVDVIKQAKELGMNLSGFMEIRLREYLTIINQEIETPRRRFELLRGNASRDFQSRAVPGWATSAKSKYRE